MDEGGTTSKTGIYCRGCGYDLRESDLRCPECGRLFDRDNPQTFDLSPCSLFFRRWMKRMLLLLLLVTLPPALGLGWLTWGWWQEGQHIRALNRSGWKAISYMPLYSWLPACLPDQSAIAYRVENLWQPKGHITEEDLQHITRLTGLRTLVLGPASMDEDLRRLGMLTRLEYLGSGGPGITDEGLSCLAAMSCLQNLSLSDTSITGSGFRHLSAMTQLQHLVVINSPVSDEGLRHLTEMRNLEYLDFRNTRITDAGLEFLRGLQGLEFLNIRGTHVTAAGVQRLQAALPQLRIYGAPESATISASQPSPPEDSVR